MGVMWIWARRAARQCCKCLLLTSFQDYTHIVARSSQFSTRPRWQTNTEYVTDAARVALFRAAIQSEDESRQAHCVLEELALPEMANDAIELCDALSEAAEQVSISTWFE